MDIKTIAAAASIDLLQKKVTEKDLKIKNLETVVDLQSFEIDLLKEEQLKEQATEKKMIYLGKFTVTYYCHCNECCGKTDRITASGALATEGVTIAMDTGKVQLGSYVYIDGVGCRIVQDKGGAIKGNKIDVYVSSHTEALQFGKQKDIDVWLIA